MAQRKHGLEPLPQTSGARPEQAHTHWPLPPEAGRISWKALALLVGFTVLLWSRTLAAPMHYWDDNVYIWDDTRLSPLNWDHLWAILTTSFFANYHPLTTLTYAADRALWGSTVKSVMGYHATHLAFYVAGVALVYVLFQRLLRHTAGAWIAAALFASSALHAEVVAWLAARKDLVCLVFYAAALVQYVRYADRRDGESRAASPRRLALEYAALLVLCLLAMLSKGYAVVLPGLFIAYDLCFAPRFRRAQVLDKLPCLALGLAVTAFTIHAQGTDFALLKDFDKEKNLTKFDRVEVLLKVFALYVGKALLPVRLCAEYLVGTGDWQPRWVAVAGGALAAGIAAGFFWFRRRVPALAFGLALFVLPLATVMNTFFTLRIWMADRYLFLPTMGAALAVVAAGVWLSTRGGELRALVRAALGLAAGAVVLVYVVLAIERMNIWSDPVLLWSDVLRKTYPALAGEGRLDSRQFGNQVTGLTPDTAKPFEALVGAYARAGNQEEADRIRKCLKISGSSLDLAEADWTADRLDEALAKFQALADTGEWGAEQAVKRIGDVWEKKGNLKRARECYERSLEMYRAKHLPATQPLYGLGHLDFATKDYRQALEDYRLLSAETPSDPHGPFYEGLSLQALGEYAEAYAAYEKALSLQPNAPPDSALKTDDLAGLHRQMGTAAEKLKRTEDAIQHYQESLRLKPDSPERKAIEETIGTLRRAPR